MSDALTAFSSSHTHTPGSFHLFKNFTRKVCTRRSTGVNAFPDRVFVLLDETNRHLASFQIRQQTLRMVAVSDTTQQQVPATPARQYVAVSTPCELQRSDMPVQDSTALLTDSVILYSYFVVCISTFCRSSSVTVLCCQHAHKHTRVQSHNRTNLCSLLPDYSTQLKEPVDLASPEHVTQVKNNRSVSQ